MDIKLKKLNKDFIDKKQSIKILSVLFMILSASIFLNTLLFLFRDRFYILRDLFSNYWQYWVNVRKFILFGPGIPMDYRVLGIVILFTLIISLILTIISFILYVKNLKTKTYFSKFITYLYKKLPIEIPLLFVIISTFLSATSMHREIYMYDKFVIYDGICLYLLLFLIDYIIYNKSNLLNMFYLSPFIKALFHKNNKKTINRKLAYSLCIGLIVQTIFLIILFSSMYGSF